MKLSYKIFFLFVLMSSFATAQNLVCNTCKEKINGEYVLVGITAFHPNHFVCDKCKEVLQKKFYTENGKYYHDECYYEIKNLKCEVCKLALDSEYLVSQNKKYHKKCFDEISPKCKICTKVLSGTISTDFYGNQFHTSHENEYKNCISCNRLVSQAITNGGKTYSDGRTICNICLADAVFEQGRISGLYEKVKTKLGSIGLTINAFKITVTGVSITELKRIAGSYYSDGVKGFCDNLITTEKNKTNYSHKIYVLNGIPEINIESIIAHELMHVWITQNVKRKLDLEIAEGSSNYISHIYLRQYNSKFAQQLLHQIENDPSKIYGDGFRNIKFNFGDKHISQLLNYLRG